MKVSCANNNSKLISSKLLVADVCAPEAPAHGP